MISLFDSTNRVTLSLQFGLNINASFRGIGGGLNPSLNSGGGRYDNGLRPHDISGNAGGQTWYWGYDNSSQNNAANHTFRLTHDATAGGNPSASADDSAGNTGFELDYTVSWAQRRLA